MFELTVFTPSYNRAHTLPKLYNSLLQQESHDKFEWLIIDDNSSDGTSAIVDKWIKEGKININYIRLNKNGGKPRAINMAVDLAQSPYLFIVDSDDYLEEGIIEFLIDKIQLITSCEDINGLGVLRRHVDGAVFCKPTFTGDFIDATNLERKEIGLDADCNEVYKISVLKNYPFKVWEDEIFTPESTVLNAMALAGYKIRWYNRAGVIAEYQDDGLTKNSWGLQKRNPMGYAMLHNSNLQHQKGFKTRFYTAVQFVAQCILGKTPSYILKTNAKFLTLMALPVALVVSYRRKMQYRHS